MGKASKRLKRDLSESEEEFGSEDSDMAVAAASSMGSDSQEEEEVEEFDSEEDQSASGDSHGEISEDDDEDGEEDDEEEGEEEDSDQEKNKDAEMEQLEKEYLNLRNEQNLVTHLKRHKDEDVLKGQAVKNQKALWDKTLELRFLLQKAFSSSNKLPKDPIRSEFCKSNEAVDKAYADIISSSQEVLGSMLDLQEALLERNPSIVHNTDGHKKIAGKHDTTSNVLDEEQDDDWLRLHNMYLRIAPFRNDAVDKWQRKTLVNTGAAVLKGKLHAFNQNISDQVAGYMRDPNRMIKRMQLRQPAVGVIGEELGQSDAKKEDDNLNEDGDPELLDDSEFYQQLLKEFLESCNLGSESMFYAMRRTQSKKRKVVDRRASKSRKIRYHVHEKIVNFMAPLPMTIPPMAPKLFENLFGHGNQQMKTSA